MKSIANFNSNRIDLKETSAIKGGNNFCQWYINQRNSEGKKVSKGQLKKGMELDAILATEGYDAAMAKGGADFMAKITV